MTKKSSLSITEEEKATLVDHLASIRKYRDLEIPRDTLMDIIDKAAQPQRSLKEVEKAVRRKLHNLVAPYLGDPPYEEIMALVPQLPSELNAPKTEQFCQQVLISHASTRERMPINREFYQRVFMRTGTPSVILDLACGLNPFALPWMNLPLPTRYIAYDLHLPRVRLINTFFRHVGQQGAAIQQDILVDPPQVEADVALFFKEAHRFEQREAGSTRKFLEQLQAKCILLSLPTETLTGRRSMREQDRALVASACAGQPWQIDEILFPSEIVFCIRKTL